MVHYISLTGVSLLSETIWQIAEISSKNKFPCQSRVYSEIINPIYEDLDVAIYDLIEALFYIKTCLRKKNDHIEKTFEKLKYDLAFYRSSIMNNFNIIMKFSHNTGVNRFLKKIDSIFFLFDGVIENHYVHDLCKDTNFSIKDMSYFEKIISLYLTKIEKLYVAASQIHATAKLKDTTIHVKKKLNRLN